MPTLPLTSEQKDAIRQYLHANYEALPKRDILILNAFEIFSNCELADIVSPFDKLCTYGVYMCNLD